MISQRLRAVNEDGEAIDGLMPKLEKDFNQFGSSIMDENGDLRSTYDLLSDLAGAWDALSSKQRQAIGEDVAGNRQVKTLNAIMQNWSIVQDTIQDANEAAGTAMQGNELYVDSIEGRITALQSAFQRLSDATINSGFVKGLVSIGTEILNITTSVGGLVPVLGTVIGLLAGFKADKIAKGFTSIANAFKLMFGAVGAGTSALTSVIGSIGGIALAASVVVGAISAIKNASVQRLQDAESASSDAKSNLVEQKSKVESLNSELENTRNIVTELSGKKTLSIVEQDTLDRSKELTKELERQLELENKLTQIAEEDSRETAVDAVDKKLATDGYKFNGSVQALHNERKIRPDWENTPKQGVFSTGFSYYQYIEENKQALPILREQVKKAEKLYDNFILNGGDAEGAKAKRLKERRDNLREDIKDTEKVLKDHIEYLGGQLGDLDYVEGENLSEADQKFNDLINEKTNTENLLIDQSALSMAEESSKIFEEYADDVEKLKKAYADLGNISTDYLIQNFSAFTKAFTDLGWTADEVAQHLNEVFSTPVEAESATTFDDLYSSLYRTTDAYTALTKAMNEQASSGVLSLETYKELLETYPEFAKLMELTAEGYVINTEAAYEYIEAQDEENLVRMKAIAAIEDLQAEQDNEGIDNSAEINSLENLVAQLDSATSAYQRFLAAKKTANQDEMHTQGKTAVDSIKEGLESGKVGTDDYQDALGFILGGDWEGKTVEELTTAGKEAQKIAQKYFSGNDAKDVSNFVDALLGNNENGNVFGQMNGDTFELFDTANIAEVAESLGIGEEAAESLFKLMEAFGANFDWEMFTEDEAKNAKDIVAATEVLNKDTEERKETQEEITEQQKAENGNKGDADEIRREKQWRKEQEQIEANQHAIDAMNESVSETEAPSLDTMSIDELKQYITELSGVIKTLNEDGLKVPVSLTDGYAEANAFLEKLEAEQPPVEVDVTANTEEADAKVKEFEETPGERKDTLTADATEAVNVEQNFTNNVGIRTDLINADLGVDNASSKLDEIVNQERTARINVETETGVTRSEALNGYSGILQLGEQAGIDTTDLQTAYKNMQTASAMFANGALDPESVIFAENAFVQAYSNLLEKLNNPEEAPEIPVEISEQSADNIEKDIKKDVDEWGMEAPIDVPLSVSSDAGETVVDEIQSEVDSSGGVEMPVTPQPSSGTLPPMPTTSTVTMDADTSSAESKIGGVVSDANATETMKVDADTSSAESAISKLDSKASKTVTKTVKIQTSGILPYASGTKNAVGGMSLVDEKGAELIEHTKQGTFELGTDSGARFTTLEKGDVVHTARETKSILSRMARIGGFFRDGLNKTKSVIGNAFATGVKGSMSFSLLNEILGSGSGGKSSSTKKLSNSKLKKYIEQLFDWIEIRLNYLQTVTDKFLLSASEAIGYFAKNSELDKALASVSNQVEASAQAYTRYMREADTIAQKAGLSAATVKNLQEGLIDITQVDKKVQENYKNYLNYYNKAQELVETLTDLREQERELAGERLDNIVDYYQWRIDRLEAVADASASRRELKTATGIQITEKDFQDAIDATTKKIQELTDSYSALSDEFANMIALGYIQEGSEAWYNYTAELEDLDDTIIQTKVDLQDLVDEADNVTLTNLQYAMAFLESSAESINQMMSLHDSQGMDGNANDYDKLIRNGMQQIANLEAQNKELERQQQGLDTLSEKYQDLQNQIDSNNASIMDLKVSQEEWNDAALDLQIKKIQDYKDELSKTNDQYERQRDLQQSIEDLERARTQRTQRVFRSGEGFVYEADQQALRDATDSLQDVVEGELINKLDDLIDALEDYKPNTNVYDANGNLLGEQYSLPSIDFSELLSAYSASNILSDAMESAKEAAYQSILAGASSSSVNLSIGDIIVNEADDGTALAESVIAQFPNALLQELYNKN